MIWINSSPVASLMIVFGVFGVGGLILPIFLVASWGSAYDMRQHNMRNEAMYREDAITLPGVDSSCTALIQREVKGWRNIVS